MTSFDDTWDVFDVLSKIRMTFFRFLLEMLSRNNSAASEDEFSLHRPFAARPSAITLIESTIKQFKSFPNDKGYMLIASVPSSERAVVIDLLQREVIIALLSVGQTPSVCVRARTHR